MNIIEAHEIILKSGNKLTPKRKLILEIISKSEKYISAKTLSMKLAEFDVNLSYDTIYRNLALLSELEILETTDISGEKRYRFSCGHSGHHHHFICTECGMTKSISACPMNRLAEDLSEFVVTGHKFEIYGVCGRCQ